jgi:mRNA-degrading endonuclease toxin of MazEF toxin-antitoxin module
MRLPLYCSTPRGKTPNLVCLQHPALAALPTQLVCPLRPEIFLTPLRETVSLDGKEYTVACDLIRPINRKTLRHMGELDPETSARILTTISRVLATDEEP